MEGRAIRAARYATVFLTHQVSTQGGYLWKYSSDLSLREGEGRVDTATVWVQPPGTPTIGEAFLKLHAATGERIFLDAARAAGEALLRGQMRSGGWQAMVEFDAPRRKRWAYRVDPPGRKQKDQSSLDDDKTQSSLRFLIRLDQALQMFDAPIHEAVKFGLDRLLEQGQFASGGFPQVWTDVANEPESAVLKPAGYPDSWPRTYPGHQQYWNRYTLNDNLAPDVLKTLWLASDTYQDSRYEKAAIRLADWLLAAQLPSPQPAWAQQYNEDMQPIWARKFEPPAITGSESQGVINALMDIYQRTGNQKYMQTIPAALDYLKRSELSDGRLARFYELKSNRPLYLTRNYRLTYSDNDLPTHYSFKVPSRIDQLRRRYQRLAKFGPKASMQNDRQNPSFDHLQKIIDSQDARGAWVLDQSMRYHPHPGPIIDMKLTADNLEALAEFLDPSHQAAD